MEQSWYVEKWWEEIVPVMCVDAHEERFWVDKCGAIVRFRRIQDWNGLWDEAVFVAPERLA